MVKDGKTGLVIAGAKVLINGKEIGITDANGKLAASIKYLAGEVITIETSKDGYLIGFVTYKVTGNDEVPIELKVASGYKTLNSCSSSNDNIGFRNLMLKIQPAPSKEVCEGICDNAEDCDFYIFVSGNINCFCGNFQSKNSLGSNFLQGTFDIHLKNSKAFL